MSGNYVQLQNKARDVVEATTLLRTRKIAQASADKEAVQARVSYDTIVSDYEKRKAQAMSADEDKVKLTSDLAELRALRTALIAQKAAAVTTRDEAAAEVTAKEEEIADYLGEPVDEVYPDPMASPPVVGSPAKPSRGIHALRAQADPLIEDAAELNQGIVAKRIELEALQANLVVAEKKLKDFKDVRDSTPPSERTQQMTDDVDEAQQEVDDLKYQISSLQASIDVDVEAVAAKEVEIEDINDQIEALMSDYRRAQRELKSDQDTYQEALADFQNIANQLEDIEGSADPAAPTSDDNVPDADGAEGSRLELMVDALDRVTTVNSAYTYLRDSLNDAKTVRKTALDAANRKKVTAEREVASAEEDLARLRKDLAVLVAAQASIEVEAAASLLEDFLKNGSLITSGAPVVDLSVERDVAKTCEDSKVRSLISRIRAAYLDESEYLALRAEFRADPVGSFFNTINDPCFALLSEAEVEALRANIKANFSRRAAALFDKYYPTRNGSGPVSRNSTFLIWVLIAVVVIAVAAFLFMRYRQ